VFKLDAQTRPFAYALLVFVLAWAIIPPLTAPNPPLDSVEAFAWGTNFELGYHKQPPLWPWHYGLVRNLGTGSWTFMWLSPVWVALAHIAVWRAARRVVDPYTALWASALMQAITFHNYFIPEFNQNIIQMAIFGGAGLFAIRAYQEGKTADWLALGAVLGVGMWAKYSVAFSIVSIATFFLLDPVARKRLAAPGPYLGAALSALIFLPHVLWMIGDKGGTITYVVERAATSGFVTDRAKYIAEVLINGALTLAFVALAIWLGRDKSQPAPADWRVTDDKSLRRLVWALAFGPIALSAAMALLFGFRIKMAWTSPFWVYAPLALLVLWKIDVRSARWRVAGAMTAGLAVLALVIYAGANVARPYTDGTPMRVHFPGPPLAAEVERVWAERAPGKKLQIVIGDAFEAGSAAYFAKDRPKVRIDDDPHKSPWVPDALKREAGAIIVWNATKQGETLPEPFRTRNPDAQTIEVVSLPYLTKADIAPVRIGIAFIPPAS
jgi:4-amino-4-deoxy-L-arabinose transferase-like glycosyltransferase